MDHCTGSITSECQILSGSMIDDWADAVPDHSDVPLWIQARQTIQRRRPTRATEPNRQVGLATLSNNLLTTIQVI